MNAEIKIILSILVLSIIGIISYLLIQRKVKLNKQIIEENSLLMKNLIDLNNKFNFNDDINEYILKEVGCKNKQSYHQMISSKIIYDEIYNNIEFYLRQLRLIKQNQELYDKYNQEYESLLLSNKQEYKIKNISLKKINKIEMKLFNEYKLKPILSFAIHVKKVLFNKRNNIVKENIQEYDYLYIYEKVILILEDIDKDKIYGKDRKKIADITRLDVIHRDDYTCQICGKKYNLDIKLYVNMINSVEKNEKILYSNLRTVCSECVEKKFYNNNLI